MNLRCFRPFSFALMLTLPAVTSTADAQGSRDLSDVPVSVAWGQKAWSTENGLPQNSVHGVLQTRDGYLWIATEGGVARFNGRTIRTRHHLPI